MIDFLYDHFNVWSSCVWAHFYSFWLPAMNISSEIAVFHFFITLSSFRVKLRHVKFFDGYVRLFLDKSDPHPHEQWITYYLICYSAHNRSQWRALFKTLQHDVVCSSTAR